MSSYLYEFPLPPLIFCASEQERFIIHMALGQTQFSATLLFFHCIVRRWWSTRMTNTFNSLVLKKGCKPQEVGLTYFIKTIVEIDVCMFMKDIEPLQYIH